MSNVYSEVTASFSRDRVLKKFDTPINTLPYTLSDIKISHNDYLTENTVNDAITKLYKNWLYLIANGEIFTQTSPTSSITGVIFDDSFAYTIEDINNVPTGTDKLSTVNELHFIKTPNSENSLVFAYGINDSIVYKINTEYNSLSTLLSSNQVEFNKKFNFDNVVSVDNAGDFLFVLDKGVNTLYKFDISGLLYNDPAIQKTSITDSKHPGRILVKSIGGKGKTNRKNKLTNPSSISIYNNEIYVLDNGNFSIKVYDLNFNFIRDIIDKELFLKTNGDLPVSITVEQESDISTIGKVFVLSKYGSITTFTLDFKNKQVYNPFEGYNSKFDTLYKEQQNFKKIISSPTNKNIIYICTNKNIIKFYKTNLTQPISFFNLLLNSSQLEKINSFDVININGIDNISIITHLNNKSTKFKFYKDDTISNKLYHENFYSNYYTLSSITVKEELVNFITFNKVCEKLVYNNSAYLENISKKIYSVYDNNRIPTISAVVDHVFTLPDTFVTDNNFYIGINEPLLTDIINRPITKIYQQQETLFNILKESFLNNNPPINVSEILESKASVDIFELIQFSTSNQTITADSTVTYNITRNKTENQTSFKIYNTLGSNTLSSDIGGYVDSSEPYTLTFEPGISSISVDFFAEPFYSGANKSFDTIIYDADNGAYIDSTNYIRTTTITALSSIYTISLSATNPTTITEGSNNSFAVIRNNDNNFYYDSISCNIFTTNLGSTSNNDYNYITSDGNYNGGSDSSYFIEINPGQVSALSASDTGTIVFNPGVSAVFFNISAVSGDGGEIGESFNITINNPSDSIATISTPNTQTVLISEYYYPISLTLDNTYETAYSGNSNYLSGVNIWSLLSGDSDFRDISSTYAVSAQLTLSDNLTVYSPNSAGALYFDSTDISNPILIGSKLKISIPSTGAIVGKGGNGGTGVAWASGSDFGDVDSLSTLDLPENDSHSGMDGYPAISLSAFSYLEIVNEGKLYGGAGGGGAGFLPVTAQNMPEVSTLSATAGGGGGAGITPDGSNNTGAGLGGSKFTGAYNAVGNGNDGTQSSGGAGGTYDLTTLIPPASSSNQFPIMSGAPGGNLGFSGGGGDHPEPGLVGEQLVINYDNSYSTTVLEIYKNRFNGGSVGDIVSYTSLVSIITSGSGEFKGRKNF